VIVLVLGGSRSGKSDVGEQIAQRLGGRVTFVATATPTDPDMAARIEAHRARRPDDWRTVECDQDLVDAVSGLDDTVLIDSLGNWVARAPGMRVDAPALATALRSRSGSTVVISEEVGLAVHAPTEAGRRFADALGVVNRAVAAVADRALLVIAGRVVSLAPLDLTQGPAAG
jgi:adenosyl cobinamide kinase/adenosyl cobinamide phosphate guanylyltransferase